MSAKPHIDISISDKRLQFPDFEKNFMQCLPFQYSSVLGTCNFFSKGRKLLHFVRETSVRGHLQYMCIRLSHVFQFHAEDTKTNAARFCLVTSRNADEMFVVITV